MDLTFEEDLKKRGITKEQYEEERRVIEDHIQENYIDTGTYAEIERQETINWVLRESVGSDVENIIHHTGNGFRGELTISYKDGHPEFLKAKFEATSKEHNDELSYKRFRDFVGDFGFITHKKYGTEKRLYGEKHYRYNPKKLIIHKSGNSGKD